MGSVVEEVTKGRGEKGKGEEEASLFEGSSSFESLLPPEDEEVRDETTSRSVMQKLAAQGMDLDIVNMAVNKAKRDPWCLPRFPFIVEKERASNLWTPSGYWIAKENKLTAVRCAGTGMEQRLTEAHDQGKGSPSYLGIKRTMEFRYLDGTKSPWILHEYQLLSTLKYNLGLLLMDDWVTRKVLKNCSRGDEARQSSNKSNSVRLPPVVSERKRKLYQADPQSGQEPSGSGSGEHPHACAPHNGETEDLQEGGSSSRPAAFRNKKSNVWQDFTRIYTKDPKVVHAVCHGCDRVFNAHSKIDGISHLRRHRLACSGQGPCWTAEDQKILQDLRQAHDLCQKEKMEINADLTKQDPSDPQSTSGYVTSSTTRQGCWKEIKKKRTAIRTDQLPVSPPQYGGMKRALQSQGQDSNKMAYIMIEIQLVDDYNSPNLFLQGDVVFRKVFQNLKDMISDSFSGLAKCLNAEDDDDEEYYNGVHEDEVQVYTTTLQDCLVAGIDQTRSGKRKRTSAPHGGSDVWLNFTRIYTSDPNTVYAVCHYCDICYSGHPNNGTSHLRRHNKKCSSKHQKLPRHNDTGSADVWEAEIWPFIAQFLENSKGTREEIRTEAEVEQRS